LVDDIQDKVVAMKQQILYCIGQVIDLRLIESLAPFSVVLATVFSTPVNQKARRRFDGVWRRSGILLAWLGLVWCPRNPSINSVSLAPTTSNEAFGSRDAEMIQGIFGTPHYGAGWKKACPCRANMVGVALARVELAAGWAGSRSKVMQRQRADTVASSRRIAESAAARRAG
jgi:hypothetical protein